MASYGGASCDAVGGATRRSVLLAGRAAFGTAIAADLAYLAAVARLTSPLGISELLFDGARKVIVAGTVLRAQRIRMLDALYLADEIDIVVRGSLRRHCL